MVVIQKWDGGTQSERETETDFYGYKNTCKM